MVFFSRKIEDRVVDLFARAAAHDMKVECEHLHKNGYPLRIGVACDQFHFTWPLHELSLSTGYLTAGTPIYAPYGIELNVHSPVSIVLDGKTPIVSHWRNLVIETESYRKMDKTFQLIAEGIEISPISSSLEKKKSQKKPELQTESKKTVQENIGDQASLKDASDVIVPVLDQEDVPPKITAEFLRFDLKHDKNHLSGHITFDDFDPSAFFASYFGEVPKIDGNLEWVFNDMPRLFENEGSSWKQHLYGKNGLLKRGELSFHTGGTFRVSGPFSFDNEGYLTAKFELVFVKHMELLTTMQHLFPEQTNNLQALFFVLGAMPKSADGYPVIPLFINHGWAKLGFLKLGRLAPF
ncbi:DUF2125 domain-containing protein [Bartonella florencae]|uniref:DUF2125 domain-containing protein n=1 Tax=Bartonella florencae TaxID=928210 RepID=UPI00054E6E66|nr:DUF2125 domain-containing protein [Bartonella florencae]